MATTPTKITGMRKNLWEYGIDFPLNTGDNIPAIGLGTWHVPVGKLQETINNAVSLGYRHFDFSTFDDSSEVRGGETLGEYIHNPLFGRNQFFVTTKLSTCCHERMKALMNIEQHIRDMKCHHMDLILMQHPIGTGMASMEETWKVLETAMKDGKTRAIGVSNFTCDQLKKLCASCEILPAVCQMECHPFNCQKDLMDFCRSKGIHITCYSPFGSDDGCKELMNDPTLMEIGKKYKKTCCQVILRWNLQNGRSVIPRSGNMQHLKENLQVFDFELTTDELRKIDCMNRGQCFVNPEKQMGMGTTQMRTEKSLSGGVGAR